MPRAKTPEQRERRDALIMRLMLIGYSVRDIGHHKDVNLSHTAVSRIVQRELANSAKHMQLLSREALNIYVGRTEMLIRASMPKALGGDIKAAEHVRRVLEQQARLYGLDDIDRDRLPSSAPAAGRPGEPPVPGLDDDDPRYADDADKDAPPANVSKLADHRKRYHA